MTAKTFMEELTAELDRNHPRMSFRQVITQGLGLQDSITSKLKDGVYQPTLERLETLAKFLGVKPTYFSLYAKRWVMEEIDTNQDLLELARALAGMSQRDSTRFLKSMRKAVKDQSKAA